MTNIKVAMIKKDILLKYGAKQEFFSKDDFIFEEGMEALYYYKLISGKVKLNNYDGEDKEFIQNIYKKGQTFGDATIFLEIDYPCNAVAMEDSVLLLLSREQFYIMLKENQSVLFDVTKEISKRLYYKGIMSPEISSHDAEKRVITLLNYLKTNWHHPLTEEELYVVDLTRQQIADMTGLRVETVIRAIKKLRKSNQLKILKGRIAL